MTKYNIGDKVKMNRNCDEFKQATEDDIANLYWWEDLESSEPLVITNINVIASINETSTENIVGYELEGTQYEVMEQWILPYEE